MKNNKYLLFGPVQLLVVHEPEDDLEDVDGLPGVLVLGLGEERGGDWLAFHLPEVALEVHARDLRKNDLNSIPHCGRRVQVPLQIGLLKGQKKST